MLIRLLKVFCICSILIATAESHAAPEYHFTLSCVGCSVPDESVAWDLPYPANTAPGFFDDEPGSWFVIRGVSVTGTSSGSFDFFAHTAAAGGGWNLCTDYCGRGATGLFSSGIPLLWAQFDSPADSPVIYTGPTSAPEFVPGIYVATDELSRGTMTLTITAVPEPESYAMMLAGLGLLGFTARRRKREAA